MPRLASMDVEVVDKDILNKAINLATNEKWGPVHVNIPRDVLAGVERYETYKIENGMSGINPEIVEHIAHSKSTRSSVNQSRVHVKPRTHTLIETFRVKAPIVWNALKLEVRLSATLNDLKNSYDVSIKTE